MDGLLPIIRRKRRPLVVADAPPVVVGNVATAQAVATKPVEPVVMIAIAKLKHAKPVTELDT